MYTICHASPTQSPGKNRGFNGSIHAHLSDVLIFCFVFQAVLEETDRLPRKTKKMFLAQQLELCQLVLLPSLPRAALTSQPRKSMLSLHYLNSFLQDCLETTGVYIATFLIHLREVPCNLSYSPCKAHV